MTALARRSFRDGGRFNARALSHLLAKALALLMLVSIADPYAHAALEIAGHQQCGMEMCKRAGKCCCRRSTPGKPHWDGKDICHHGSAQPPAIISPASVPEPLTIGPTLEETHALTLAISITPTSTNLLVIRLQRPPPTHS
jgi:hypothetical protein